ncbi:MAG: 16S rRNA (adenine(1518)-N(6)/adenine(1519)-N(6))-dimethyltransferase RsmA [Acidimicrobiia bacterium]
MHLTPATVNALLAEHGISPKKSLGQNFLVDANIARRIVGLAGVEEGSRVLEIGPGLGSLTLALCDAGARVLAVELDERLAGVLVSVLDDAGVADQVHVEVADANQADLAGLLADRAGAGDGDGPVTCVSNLPYNVAVPVVMRLLEAVPTVTRIVVMVQREVGERLAAAVGDEQYGAVSVKVAYFAEAALVGKVPPSVFVPRPKVDSALVRLERREAPPVEVPSEDALFGLVRAGFAQRRKMLRRSLAGVLGDRATGVLDAAGVAPTARAEELDLDAWAAVARCAAA